MSDLSNQSMTPARMRLIGASTASSCAIWAFVLYLMLATGAMSDTGFGEEPVFPIGVAGPLAAGLGAVIVAASFAFRRVLESSMLGRDNTLMTRARVMIVIMVWCESAGLIGLMLGFMTGDLLWPFTCMGVGFAGAILHFPTTAWMSQADDYPQE
ncbi:MAG: hypothetical protein GY851_26895 [bacterium]|nr:hypothetical protein [bacterium]